MARAAIFWHRSTPHSQGVYVRICKRKVARTKKVGGFRRYTVRDGPQATRWAQQLAGYVSGKEETFSGRAEHEAQPFVVHTIYRRNVDVASSRLPAGRLKFIVSFSLGLIKDLVNFKPAHTGGYGPLNSVSLFVTKNGGTNRRQNRDLPFTKVGLCWKHQ